jgi:membrane protease YdiL (CAAX protease family)
LRRADGSPTDRAIEAGARLSPDPGRSALGRATAVPSAEPSLSPRLLLGLVIVAVLFDRVATALGSDRGQAGLAVGSLVVVATLAVEALVFRKSAGAAVRALGLGRPAAAGLVAATVLSLLLLLVFPVYAAATGVRLALTSGWLRWVPGLFAQAGVAEEVFFRGYLFRHLRAGRSFVGAASAAAGPFAVVHVPLFRTMPWPVALAAIGLAVVLSFPLAALFELGGHTIWAPAILHFVAQGAIKVVTAPPEASVTLPIAWMAACATVPLLALAWRRRSAELDPP